MDIRHALTTGFLAITLASCGGGPAPDTFGRADGEAIRASTLEFAAAYNAQDPDKVMTFYSNTAVLMPPNSSTMRGQESIKSFYVNRFEEGANALEIEPQDVGGHGTLAYVSGTYSLKLTPPGGPESSDRGKFLWVARRLANQWRYEYAIWSSDLPPRPPAPPPAS